MTDHLPSVQQLSETQLNRSSLRRPRRDPSLEEWLSQPIHHPKGERPVRFADESEKKAAHRKVRFNRLLGVIFEYTDKDGPRVDFLNFQIGNQLYTLQQHLIATEGRPSAVLQQEARDAYLASTPAQEESPEIRAYLERIWGPLKYPSISGVPWTPFAEKRINLSGLFPEPR